MARPSPADGAADSLGSIEALTVASLNMHGGVDGRGEPFDVVSAIRQLEAEVICLQETWQPTACVAPTQRAGKSGSPDMRSSGKAPGLPDHTAPARGWHTDVVAEAAAQLGATLIRAPLSAGPDLGSFGIPASSGHGQLSIAVLTTLPVTCSATVELGQVPGDVVPRLAQVLTLELADRTALRLVNTHLTYRLASPVQLYRLRRALDDSPNRTIIAGDLNMPRFVARLMPGYTGAVSGRTWPAEHPLVQLDHVLVNRNVEILDATVLPTAGSDHLPIWVRLGLRA